MDYLYNIIQIESNIIRIDNKNKNYLTIIGIIFLIYFVCFAGYVLFSSDVSLVEKYIIMIFSYIVGLIAFFSGGFEIIKRI